MRLIVAARFATIIGCSQFAERSAMPATEASFCAQDIRDRVERLPRVRLTHLPTPLERLPRFSKALGGPSVFIKRDDCSGLAFGGNKARHNEFLLADALAQGADMLVWGAGVQSNNCRQTAASCANLGLDCHLVLSRGSHGDEVQGNLLLDHLLGATYEIVDAVIGPELDDLIAQAANRFRAQGRKVYNWDRDLVRARAAVSYTLCMAELVEQLDGQSVVPAAIYVCSAGSTGAGLALGKAALGVQGPLLNMLPIHWPWDEAEDMCRLANEAAELIDLPNRLTPGEIIVEDGFIGPGYGVPTPECMEAMALLARTEGILVESSYTGKALAGLIDHVRAGRYSPDQSIVFIHTGGTPSLFAYRDEIVRMIPAQPISTLRS
jgi:1-aminocyclopropane-1-carboxylate deaminase/D-cysteine desulfhydrase-like pyridoxal-dependent ACC family enzyme